MAILRIKDNTGKITEIPAIKGSNGKSAYEVAVDNGFEGSETEWLESLKVTPIKGVDYFTEEDKTEMIQSVIDSLGGNPIFGYVDADNNIVIQGDLTDGTYTLKYGMEDGSLIDIGELEIDNSIPQKFSIIYYRTNCTTDNSPSSITEGETYIANITPSISGYEITSITVTMGGKDITSSAVSGNTITITNVTGDIVITAVAEEAVVEYKNFFNSSEGKVGRIGSDGLNRTDSTRCFITNYIEVQNGDIVKVSGCDITGTIPSSANSYFMACYDSSKAKLYASGADKTDGTYFTLDSDTGTEAQITITDSNVKYVRFTCTDPSGPSTTINTSNIVINIKRNGEWLTN